MATIQVDDREEARTLTQVLCDKYGYVIEHRRLELADYHLPGGTLVERKTMQDFALSVIDGRLFSQAYRLATSQARCILILEGLGRNSVALSQKAFRGALISLAQTYGLPVLRTLNECDTGWCMNRLIKQKQVAGLKYGPSPSGRAKRQITRRLHVLRALPGIGPRLAASLYDHFGSINTIANSTIPELAEAPGIGRERARDIFDTMHEQPGIYRTTSPSNADIPVRKPESSRPIHLSE